MPPDNRTNESAWVQVQKNRSYWPGALTDAEGEKIKWHSPHDERSSQVFCISAFGGIRSLPDCGEVFGRLSSDILPDDLGAESWELHLEYVDRKILGETGQGIPTNVDVYCSSPRAVICIESKFLFDAMEGFGGCGQVKKQHCAGFHGRGSDRKTGSSANCRLTISDGRRDPRLYWDIGRRYFASDVFREQVPGEACPIAGSNFQLMRNFLFAAQSAGPNRAFAMLAAVPEKTSAAVTRQVSVFKETILRGKFRPKIGIVTYDRLVNLLSESRHEQSRDLAKFLTERMTTLL